MDQVEFQDKAKEAAGKAAASLIETGMKIGLGTGSTARYFIEELGTRCREGLKIEAVATSLGSETLAKKCGIPLLDIQTIEILDLAVDGADEIDLNGNMIKGGGGALLREKIVAAMAREMVVIIDQKKQVKSLGAFPLPVEIAVYGCNATLKHLHTLCPEAHLRLSGGRPFVTDNGNYIVDLPFQANITDPFSLDRALKNIPGVLETGLFLNLAKKILIGNSNGSTTLLRKNSDF